MPIPNRFLFFFFILCIITSTTNRAESNPHHEFPCHHPAHNSYPFCDPILPIPTRAQSLISLLTLDEKIQQLSDNVSAIPRLGIPAYEWWSESPHGVAVNGPGVSFNGTIRSATVFPQVILTTASFNRTLWRAIASATAVEARAMFNVGQAGLTFWSPNVNIFRDPRWGRGQETAGEDPMVVSSYAIEYVKGFQGSSLAVGRGSRYGFGRKRVMSEDYAKNDDRLMLSACCKHYIAYDLENWKNATRYNFSAVITDQDMEDTYQPPFRSCIKQGGASCLMCSYTRIYGIPACANKDLLQKARSDWGFRGYIVSDCDAVATIYEYQNYTKSKEDAVAIALKAGTDINCGTYMLRNMKSAVEQGKVSENDIDKALLNLFSVQFRLGLFDGPKTRHFAQLGPRDVCTSQHRTLSLEAARQSIVLLKNEQMFLPLDKKRIASVAVIGPMANTTKLGGGYTGVPCNAKSIIEGIQEYVKETFYADGCSDVPCNSTSGFDEALFTARKAENVIVVAGLDLSQETEDRDRYSLLLPGYQMTLISRIAAVSEKPLILVLTGGGPLDVSFAQGDPRIASILWIGYPGEMGGRALSEIIFGDYNPGGRLPVTWYPESFTNVPMTDMNMRADPSRGYPGRTYRFYNGDRLYGFGHGLSYTSFTSTFLSIPNRLSLWNFAKTQSLRAILNKRTNGLNYIHVDDLEFCSSLRFHVRISVMNNGERDGSQVVILFSRAPKVIEGTPQKQVIGFARIHAISGKSSEASILVDPCDHLSVVHANGNRILALGDHTLMLEDTEQILSISM